MVSVLSFGALVAAAPAAAHSGTASGGAGYAPPTVTGLACDDAGGAGCPKGAELQLKGENLAATSSVVFLGGRSIEDDSTALPVTTGAHRVVVRIPAEARSGRLRALAGGETAESRPLKISKAKVKTSGGESGVFPIRGKHDYGTASNAFGGGHQGQDIFAKCATRLVAALPGEVTVAKYQERAGNYVVIKAEDGTSQAYMHMQSPAIVGNGDIVAAGQQIGLVGDTGRATGCHLHFELWTAPGWYAGGSPIDPLPTLEAWDAAS